MVETWLAPDPDARSLAARPFAPRRGRDLLENAGYITQDGNSRRE